MYKKKKIIFCKSSNRKLSLPLAAEYENNKGRDMMKRFWLIGLFTLCGVWSAVGQTATETATTYRNVFDVIRSSQSAFRSLMILAPCPQTNEYQVIEGIDDESNQAKSDRYPKGMAGLMAPMQQHRISTPYFDNLRIYPIK